MVATIQSLTASGRGFCADELPSVRSIAGQIDGLPRRTRRILADLVSGYSPALLATRYGVKPNAINTLRRRAERKIGVVLPRAHNVGRPISKA